MFKKFIARLKQDNTPEDIREAQTKRQYARRACDTCVSVIGEKTFPIENWSMGGALIYADSRLFTVDNELNVVMRFKLRGEILDIPQRGRVVRKTKDHIALQFAPINDDTRNQFQNVIDDHVAAQFAGSHTLQ